jgi:hypothetical protein
MKTSKETGEERKGQRSLLNFRITCVVVLAAALLSLAFPLYFLASSAGTIYALTPFGWAGDATIPWSIGILSSQDYSFLGWSLLLTAGGAGILLAAVWKQEGVSKTLWAALGLVAILPVLSTAALLAMDGFPMVYVVATNSVAQVTVTAAWGIPLWGLTICTAVAFASGTRPATTELKTPLVSNAQDSTKTLEDLEFAILERARERQHASLF